MKIHKLKRIVKGENPIIRVTYKTWWGKLKTRDVCQSTPRGNYWVYMDDNYCADGQDSINWFVNSDLDLYYVNSSLI